MEPHENIKWLRLDIGDENMVKATFEQIFRAGGADFILHLAGYYDFTNKSHPEYERTNVKGTSFILKYARDLGIKRFIFTSSLVVTRFGKEGPLLNENSPADSASPYAVSKKKAEALLAQYSAVFPCSVIRCAAIFSDWCEYGPLYTLLTIWLSEGFDSNILTGRGEAAVPYLHTRDLNALIHRIINNSDVLKSYDIYVASPQGCSSQRELHELALRYYFGQARKIIFVPVWFAWISVAFINFAGWLRGKTPFIKPWMILMTDKKMMVDASKTYRILNWKPVDRFEIKRRLLFLIENKKSNPYEWVRRNEQAIQKAGKTHPNFIIYESMLHFEEQIIDDVLKELQKPEKKNNFYHYLLLDEKELLYRFKNLYKMLKTAVLLGDRLHVLQYARSLAVERFKEHFEVREVKNAINLLGDQTVRQLKTNGALKNLDLRIHDEILLTIQLIIDELEDSYERLSGLD